MALLAPAANATFPGRNGKLAISFDNCDDGTQIRAYAPGGRALGRLTDCKRYRSDPDWSGDGRRLAYTESTGVAPIHFVVAAADGSHRRVLPITRGLSDYTGLSLSPGGSYVAFPRRGGAIRRARLDGRERIHLRDAKHGGQDPRWSPDGRTIAFVDHVTGISLIDARSGRLIRRPAVAYTSDPDWSPDGSKLVYVTPNGIAVAPANTRHPRLVMRTQKTVRSPAWSPDGRSIVWIQFERRTPALWRMRADGTRPRKVTELPRSATQLAWQPRR